MADFVTITGLDVPGTVAEQARNSICVSNPGRAYAPLDMDARGLTSVIRITPHLFSTAADIDGLVEVLDRVATSKPS